MKKSTTILLVATAASMFAASWIAALFVPALAWIALPVMIVVGILGGVLTERRRDHQDQAEGFSDGDSVEVDCRRCGQFNRVPAARLRHRPLCGRCKTRLMPGRRIVLCRSKRIDGRLRDELDELWSDEELLWDHLADHLAERQRFEDDQRRATVNL